MSLASSIGRLTSLLIHVRFWACWITSQASQFENTLKGWCHMEQLYQDLENL